MARLPGCAVAISALFVVMMFGIAAPSAQEEECKGPVTAVGAGRPLKFWAQATARKAWRLQVEGQFGKEYRVLESAEEVDYRCSRGAVIYSCTLTAIPCRVQGTLKDAGGREERADNVAILTFSLQTELQRVGCYRKGVDGRWGSGSREALERFADRMDIDLTTEEPSEQALNAVKEVERRVCR